MTQLCSWEVESDGSHRTHELCWNQLCRGMGPDGDSERGTVNCECGDVLLFTSTSYPGLNDGFTMLLEDHRTSNDTFNIQSSVIPSPFPFHFKDVLNVICLPFTTLPRVPWEVNVCICVLHHMAGVWIGIQYAQEKLIYPAAWAASSLKWTLGSQFMPGLWL